MKKTLIQILNDEGIKTSIDFQNDMKKIEIFNENKMAYLLIITGKYHQKKIENISLDLQIICDINKENLSNIALRISINEDDCPIISSNDLGKLIRMARRLSILGYNVKIKNNYSED